MKRKTKFKGEIDVSGIKRLYADIQIEADCPICGSTCKVDLNDDYLSHVEVGEETDLYPYCEFCNDHFTLPVRIEKISITLKVLK